MQHYISDSIYGLTLAWITSENSTKQLECWHLDSIFFTVAGPHPMLARLFATVSGVDSPCPCPSPTACQLLFPTSSLLASRYLFRPRRDFKSENPLSGFAPKQTKESSAWRATHIALQMYEIVEWRREYRTATIYTRSEIGIFSKLLLRSHWVPPFIWPCATSKQRAS